MSLAYGLSAGIWHLRKHTYDATAAATYDATAAATYAATRAATRKHWLHNLAFQFVKESFIPFLLECCKRWYNAYQGGNMWAAFPAYAESMRDVIKLSGLTCWDKYQAWEDCAKEGGFRVMHDEFCIVSDFPKEIHRDKQNRPHCETGPSHLWRDGFSIYHLNGVKVPEWVVMTPAEKIDPKQALEEKNADVQREIIRKIGPEKMLLALNAKTIDEAHDPKTGLSYALKEMKVGNSINRKYLWFEHASMPGVFYAKPVPPETQKALHGRAWICSIIEREELNNINAAREKQILAELPESVS
jgi:hypothetical protein